jgi:hypothetical protein
MINNFKGLNFNLFYPLSYKALKTATIILIKVVINIIFKKLVTTYILYDTLTVEKQMLNKIINLVKFPPIVK